MVADRLIAQHRGADAGDYDGRGICYIEYGNNEVARVNVQFLSGQTPVGIFNAPSLGYAADKQQFGADRIRRWFGREWTNF